MQTLQTIFRTELDGQLLGEMLEAIDSANCEPAACTAGPSQQSVAESQTAQQPPTQPGDAALRSPPGTAGSNGSADCTADQAQPQMPSPVPPAAECQAAGTCTRSSKPKDNDHTLEVLGMLQALTGAGRFFLARQLMGAKGQLAASSIFTRLRHQVEEAGSCAEPVTHQDLDALQAAYCIN